MTYGAYSEEYIEACFYLWYQNNRSRGRMAANDGFPMADDGTPPPTLTTVYNWKKKYGWDERADALDAEVSINMEKDAIQKKIDATKKLVKTGEEMIEKGMAHIKQQGFDSSSAAVRAVLGGAELVSKFVGMGEMMMAIAQMNDKQLTKELYRLMGKSDEVIDAEAEDADSPTEDNNE